MARKKSKNPHEARTKMSALLAAIGALCTIVLLVGVLRHADLKEFVILYRQSSIRFFAILGSFLVGWGCAVVGFFLAHNAAGEKRNSLSGLAWQMFFVNALIVLVTMCTFVIFWFAKENVD